MALSGPILDPHIARDVPRMSPDGLPDGSNDSQMGPNVLEVTPTWAQMTFRLPPDGSNDQQMSPNDRRMTLICV